jgi:hypothetical protein
MEQIPLQAPPVPGLGKTIGDIFTSPSDAFQSLKGTAPSTKLWLLPMLAMIAIIVCSTVLLFTNDSLKAEFKENQSRSFQQKVESGKMTVDEVEKAESVMDSMGNLLVVFGIVGGTIAAAIYYFGAALALWLAGKFLFKASAGYLKYLELYGLATWIGVLGGIVTLAMMFAFGTMTASPSAALAVLGNYDTANSFHRLLSALNIFSIWETIIVGIGLSVFSGKSKGTGISAAFVLWALWAAATICLGLGK